MTMQTFSFTGKIDSFTMPLNIIDNVTVTACGAKGGKGDNGNQNGGNGASITATFNASSFAGKSLTILVGSKGANSTSVGRGGAGGGASILAVGKFDTSSSSFDTFPSTFVIAAGGNGGNDTSIGLDADTSNTTGSGTGGLGTVSSGGGGGFASSLTNGLDYFLNGGNGGTGLAGGGGNQGNGGNGFKIGGAGGIDTINGGFGGGGGAGNIFGGGGGGFIGGTGPDPTPAQAVAPKSAARANRLISFTGTSCTTDNGSVTISYNTLIGTEIWVSVDGNGDGSKANPTNIEAAQDFVNSNFPTAYTIRMLQGTYTKRGTISGDQGTLNFTTNVTIIGETSNNQPVTLFNKTRINSTASELNCQNCVFSQNTAEGNGGAILASTANCQNCVFSESSTYVGGAIFATDTVNCQNCVFSKNNVVGGAAMRAKIVNCQNCVFSQNSAGSGGAILASTANCQNCVFSDNKFSPTIKLYSSNTVLSCQYSLFDQSKDIAISNAKNFKNDNNTFSFPSSSFINISSPIGPDNIWMTIDDGLQPKQNDVNKANPSTDRKAFWNNTAFPYSDNLDNDILGQLWNGSYGPYNSTNTQVFTNPGPHTATLPAGISQAKFIVCGAGGIGNASLSPTKGAKVTATFSGLSSPLALYVGAGGGKKIPAGSSFLPASGGGASTVYPSIQGRNDGATLPNGTGANVLITAGGGAGLSPNDNPNRNGGTANDPANNSSNGSSPNAGLGIEFFDPSDPDLPPPGGGGGNGGTTSGGGGGWTGGEDQTGGSSHVSSSGLVGNPEFGLCGSEGGIATSSTSNYNDTSTANITAAEDIIPGANGSITIIPIGTESSTSPLNPEVISATKIYDWIIAPSDHKFSIDLN